MWLFKAYKTHSSQGTPTQSLRHRGKHKKDSDLQGRVTLIEGGGNWPRKEDNLYLTVQTRRLKGSAKNS